MREGIIGQLTLLDTIDQMAQTGWPRFVILQGQPRSGKKLITGYISRKLDIPLINCGIKADDVRETIALAHKQSEPVIYLFANVDNMSLAAKNALLKVTEEPPRKAYFILTVQQGSTILPTLYSRSLSLQLQPYTTHELTEYIEISRPDLSIEDKTVMSEVSSNPGDVQVLGAYQIKDFLAFVIKVVDNVGRVTGANAFKIGQKLSTKPDDGGWDIGLFLRATMHILGERALDPELTKPCTLSLIATQKHLQELMNITGVQKSMLVDSWILSMREIWLSHYQ